MIFDCHILSIINLNYFSLKAKDSAVAECSAIKEEDCITVKHEPIEERSEVRHC
jgi:hypothetical protein